MALGDRCDHIIALIDEVLDTTSISSATDATANDDTFIDRAVARQLQQTRAVVVGVHRETRSRRPTTGHEGDFRP